MIMTLVEIPGGPDAALLTAILTHHDYRWALQNPHEAMQIHAQCQLSECVAKKIGLGELQRLGKLIAASNPVPRTRP